MPIDVERIQSIGASIPKHLPFKVQKLGHIVLNVSDIERAVRFYTHVLGFKISDVYPDSMVPGGMVFMRFNTDHHGVALVGDSTPKDIAADSGGIHGRPAKNVGLNHCAFEMASLDEVFRARDHLKKNGVELMFEGRRRAGCQIAVEFNDPDGNHLELYWNLDQVGTSGYVRPSTEWRQALTLESAVDHPAPGQDTTLADPSLRR